MKLNLGCGKDILEGWVNIDRYPSDQKVIQGDIRSLDFPKSTVETIRAIDVLEHVPRAEVLETLKHWNQILVNGGTVEIRCPDVRKQCELLLDGTWSTATWAHMVFGGQDAIGNFHMAGFDQELLSELARMAGFSEIKTVTEHDDVPVAGNANFRLFAKKP